MIKAEYCATLLTPHRHFLQAAGKAVMYLGEDPESISRVRGVLLTVGGRERQTTACWRRMYGPKRRTSSCRLSSLSGHSIAEVDNADMNMDSLCSRRDFALTSRLSFPKRSLAGTQTSTKDRKES